MTKVKASRNFAALRGNGIILMGETYDITEFPPQWVADMTEKGYFVYISEREPAKIPDDFKNMKIKGIKDKKDVKNNDRTNG